MITTSVEAGSRAAGERSELLAGGPGAALVLAGAPARAVYDGVRLDPVAPLPAGLTIVLRRRPRPDESDISGLIDRALVRLDVRAGLRPEDLAELRARLGEPVEALLPLSAKAALEDAGELIAGALDQRLAGELSATIDADVTRRLLQELAGERTGLTLAAEVAYARAFETVTVTVRGMWSDLHAELARAAGPEGAFGPYDLAAALAVLQSRGKLRVFGDHAGDARRLEAAVELLAPMLAAIAHEAPGEPGAWRLDAQAPLGWPLDASASVSVAERALLRVATPLADAWEAHPARPLAGDMISLVVETPAGHEVIARRSVGTRRETAAAPRVDRMVKADGRSASPGARLGAGVNDPAMLKEALRHGDRPLPPGLGRAVVRPLAQVEPGPVLDQPANDSWPDQRDADVRWYVPELTLIAPVAGAPESDGLQLRFRPAGLGAGGRPAVTGELVAPLRAAEPAGVRAARAAGAASPTGAATTFRPVSLDAAEATIELSFTDTDTGQPGQRKLSGVIAAGDGTLVLRVTLADQWARLAYATLSSGRPVPCRVAHLVAGWISPDGLGLPVGELTLRPKVTLERPGSGARVALRSDAGWRLAITQRADLAYLKLAPALEEAEFRAVDVRVRKVFPQVHTVPVTLPCDRHPDRFVEELADGTTRSVGCRDAFGIGAVDARLLAEIPELRRGGARVLRHLAQPDRFVLLPGRYVLSRRPEAPHDPAVILHAALDPDPADVRIVLDAMLQPELSPADLAWIRAGVRRLAGGATPILDWPTALVEATPAFRWLGLPAGSTLESLACDDGRIRVSASLKVPDWLVMRSVLEHAGIQGSLTLTLADQTSLRSDLLLDLKQIKGPWPDGPVEVGSTAAGQRLRNRLAQPVGVTSLLDEAGAIAARVDRVLDPLGELRLDGVVAMSELVAAAEPVGDAPATVEEARVLVEDVECQVIVVLTIRLTDSGREALDVELELPATGEQASVRLTDREPASQVAFTLPLTGAVVPTTLRWRARPPAGGDTAAGWRDHDLTASSIVAVGDATT